MVVRRGHHEKQEVDDAFEKLCIGDSFAEAALTSSVPRRTLFKKAQGRHIGIMIEGLCTHMRKRRRRVFSTIYPLQDVCRSYPV